MADPMQRAIELAQRALGWCSPNPAVGAVVTHGSEVVGEGFTQPPGGLHAEIVALRAAGPAASGATLYVTLEPCCHYGRTPPCTEAVVAAGVREVRVATFDPSPWVNGQGIGALRAAGVIVHVGEREAGARKLNEAYFKWVATGWPFVILKYAMTADGKIATRMGSSRWVTGLEARRYVARLRSQVDAVLVGIGTILADDPQLTARPGELGQPELEPAHQPRRVVLDSRGRLPAGARIVRDSPDRTMLCITERAPAVRLRKLERLGVQMLRLPEREGRVDIRAALRELGSREVTSVLVESGGTVAASLLAAGGVDKVLAFVAPKIVGGAGAPTSVGGPGVDLMEGALELRDPEWVILGKDALLSGYLDGREMLLHSGREGA